MRPATLSLSVGLGPMAETQRIVGQSNALSAKLECSAALRNVTGISLHLADDLPLRLVTADELRKRYSAECNSALHHESSLLGLDLGVCANQIASARVGGRSK